MSGLGGEKSSDEVVSIWLYKCLSSYSCFYIELGSGTEGWQEGAGSRRRSCKKQFGFSVNPRREEVGFLDKQLWCGNLYVGLCSRPWDRAKVGFCLCALRKGL